MEIELTESEAKAFVGLYNSFLITLHSNKMYTSFSDEEVAELAMRKAEVALEVFQRNIDWRC